MKVSHLWYVTRPRYHSEVEDVCFSATVQELAMQFKGGLDPNDVLATFTEESEARELAQGLLVLYKKYRYDEGAVVARALGVK